MFAPVRNLFFTSLSCYCHVVPRKATAIATGMILTLGVLYWPNGVSADEPLDTPITSTSVDLEFDVESGLLWTAVDETTIEVSYPD
jgi:hypothetical protein